MSNQDKNKKYSEEDLKKAASDYYENKKSVRQICREYSIPKTTFLDKISGRRPMGIKKRGPEPALSTDGERKVVNWLLNISKCGFPVKKQELLATVQKIIKEGGFKNKFKDDRPGQKWFELFLARNKEISLKNAEGINNARAQVTEESIKLWFRELEKYLEDIQQKEILTDPTRIFNGDETGFSLCPKTGKVLGPKGYKNLYQIKPGNEKENITVLLTFNATGDVCPPCVVFPYIRPPKAVADSMPPGWCLGRSESGWMKGDVFFEYITNDFNNWLQANGIKKPVLLLVDGHKSHMSLELSTKCEQMEIILYALPPNTTHILQPADVSVFAPLKKYWKTTVRQFTSKTANLNCSVTKTNFCILLKDALSYPNMRNNIKNGFKRCGLCPFDANSPDYSKCVKNTLENLQPVDEESQNVTLSDIKSFKKVLKILKPTLKAKNINIRNITKAVNNLKKSLPTDVGTADFSLGTESENTTQNSSTAFDVSNDLNNNKQQSAQPLFSTTNNDLSISTLHLSGSYLDVGSIVSLDDILFMPSNLEQPPPTIEQTPFDAFQSPLMPAESTLEQPPKISSDPFKNHLMLPEVHQKQRKSGPRIPASISSDKWRQYYENKEQIKKDKQEALIKRKMERIEKQEQKKILKESQNVGEPAAKRKKKKKPVKIVSQKENAQNSGTKCSECDHILISDVEDDDEKNIGCDSCMRWYHLKCTEFAGLNYSEVHEKTFECKSCIFQF